MSFKKAVSLLFFIVIITLAAQNPQSVEVSLATWQLHLPLTMIILVSAIASMLALTLWRADVDIIPADDPSASKTLNLYVGNLPGNTTDNDLSEMFSQYGKVQSVSLIKDQQTGEPKGYAFVRLVSSGDSRHIIEQLNGRDCKGRPLNVNYARNRGHHRRPQHHRQNSRRQNN